MKRLSAFILVLSVIITVFTACSDKKEPETTTIPTTVMGEVARSYVNQYGEGKTVVFETDKKETLKLDNYDKDGNLKYTEEYLYDPYGAVYGYSYYDKSGTFVAKYLFAGEKVGYFYEDGSAMTENEFSQRMDRLGIYGS